MVFRPNQPVDDDDTADSIDPVPVWRRRKVQVVGGICAVLLLWMFTNGGKPAAKHDDAATSRDQFVGAITPYEPPAATPKPVEVAAAPPPFHMPPPAAPVAVPMAKPAPAPVVAVAPTAPSPRALAAAVTGAQQKPARPVMMSFAVAPPPKPVAPAAAPPPETTIAFKPGTIPGAQASAAIDDTYQLMPGLLPMVLDTAIQSDLPGPLMAHLPGNVYSPKGVLLMEAGTQIIGRYESMKNNSGSRLSAVSTFAHTPNGIWIPLAGEPLADDLGRNGLDGEVNNHLWQRFGGAALLTIAESLTSIIQAKVSQGGNSYLNIGGGGGGGGSASGLAQQILQSQINIPPTFSKHAGETIALFLDQPVDFSKSYRIQGTK